MGVAVSVVMPVYNAGQYLLPALLSLEQQDLPPEQFELVAIDDGSTDGSGELLDRWAAQRPHVAVLHQPNSGWPGQPRNRGVEASTGEYVFFMDADDYLGPQALRRMVELARRWDSDVLSPKVVGVGGRRITRRVWAQTTPEADLLTAFGDLHPHKLFRRAFLLEHGLRFPEGKVRLEDAIFVSRAFLTARRVATAGDYDYYYLRSREDDGNISRSSLGGARYVESVRTICRTVRELRQDTALSDHRVRLWSQRAQGMSARPVPALPAEEAAGLHAGGASSGRRAGAGGPGTAAARASAHPLEARPRRRRRRSGRLRPGAPRRRPAKSRISLATATGSGIAVGAALISVV